MSQQRLACKASCSCDKQIWLTSNHASHLSASPSCPAEMLVVMPLLSQLDFCIESLAHVQQANGLRTAYAMQHQHQQLLPHAPAPPAHTSLHMPHAAALPQHAQHGPPVAPPAAPPTASHAGLSGQHAQQVCATCLCACQAVPITGLAKNMSDRDGCW